jgi:transmembrane sensor
MESVKQTEQRAAEWLTRRDSGNWSPSDQIALDQWLNESTGNVVTFIRLDTAWSRADRFKALGAGFPPGKIPTPEELNLSPFFTDERDASEANSSAILLDELQRDAPQTPDPGTGTGMPRTRRFRVIRAAGALAASIALAYMATATWFYWPAGPDYKTPIGGTASVPMADGSKVTLNTDSAISVALTENEREVRLDQGEAFFEVAHDPNRPFVVTAGDKRVIAVGTKFSVRRIGDDIRVFVTEGKVRLEEGGGSARAFSKTSAHASNSHLHARAEDSRAAADQEPSGQFLLAAGGVARTDGEGILVQQKPLAEVEESLSWRAGYIIFHESSLADAVTELNRYNVRKIVIEDPDIAEIKLSGKFRTTDFDAFVRLIEGGFPLHVRQSSDRIVLTRN